MQVKAEHLRPRLDGAYHATAQTARKMKVDSKRGLSRGIKNLAFTI